MVFALLVWVCDFWCRCKSSPSIYLQLALQQCSPRACLHVMPRGKAAACADELLRVAERTWDIFNHE